LEKNEINIPNAIDYVSLCVKCTVKMQKLIFISKQLLQMVVVYNANENVKSLGTTLML